MKVILIMLLAFLAISKTSLHAGKKNQLPPPKNPTVAPNPPAPKIVSIPVTLSFSKINQMRNDPNNKVYIPALMNGYYRIPYYPVTDYSTTGKDYNKPYVYCQVSSNALNETTVFSAESQNKSIRIPFRNACYY